MKQGIRILVDNIEGNKLPVYDTTIGDTVLVARPGKKCRVKAKASQLLVPLYPITTELLRCMAETIELGEKEGKWSGCLIVSAKKEKAGLFIA